MCLFSSCVDMDVQFGQKIQGPNNHYHIQKQEQKEEDEDEDDPTSTYRIFLSRPYCFVQPTQSVHGQYLQTRVLHIAFDLVFPSITRCLIMTSILLQVGCTAPCSDFYLISVRVAKRVRSPCGMNSSSLSGGLMIFLPISSMWN